MKKIILVVLSIVVFPLIVISQPCLPAGILFTTQAQIDGFQINHPNCTEIEGYVWIGYLEGTDIYNLNGLSVLTSIGGNLVIYDNPLTSLTGLDNVTSIGGSLAIGASFGLFSLTGLDNVTTIGGNLSIEINNLTSLTGLDNVTSIGGDLKIRYNYALTSLTGLDGVTSIGGSLVIEYNGSLSTCEVESVCAYLANPNGEVSIFSNAVGCNSPDEVQDSCIANGISIDENYIIEEFMVSPNPFTISTTLSYTLDKPSKVFIRIFNSQGQLIEKIEQEQPKGQQQVQWNAEGLPAGMYYFRIQAGEMVGGGKMVKS